MRYNSIGPKGAKALAGWSVLASVWQLDLHDNFIGDEGLIALARSSNLGRLIELDLEQDCWNGRAFTFDEHTARAVAESNGLPRLDGFFSGCVDEYHGTAYSPGFTKAGLDVLRKSPWMRPACKASCSDFAGVSEYLEREEFDESADPGESDFRQYPYTLNVKEASGERHNMHQLRAADAAPSFDFTKPAGILAVLPELNQEDEDIIEGLEFRDPTPSTDVSLRLTLSLEDDQKPLPEQAGKFLSDTLGGMLRATSLGRFDWSGSGSCQADDGRDIPTDVSFSVGFKGDPQPALQLIREALWWVGTGGDQTVEILLGSREPR